MQSPGRIRFGFAIGSLALAAAASAQPAGQRVVHKAPTAADWAAVAKLPDFTGVWEAGGGGRGGGGRGGPSLTPEYAAKAKAATPVKAEENLTANCLPPGLPGIMGQPYPLEFLMTPGLVTIISEAYTQVRSIFTDGRPLPEDPDPTFYGTSVGHWDGNVLVADSVGFADVPRGLNFPYSGKLKVTERFQLTAPDTMTVETTIADPLALTMPYSMGTRTLQRHRSWTLSEYICEENNRNGVDDSGKARINLANPQASPK